MSIYKKSMLATALLLSSTTLALASNPIIKHIYTADPSAAVFDDTVYIYTGHDQAEVTDTGYRMYDWHVFSSQDLVNWQDHGPALSLEDFSWASADAWAGEVIKRGDKYYWYVPVNNDRDGWFGIGVAESDSPSGPFHDALGHALITDSMTPNETLDIDPTVFIDNQGQAYMFWGNATDGGLIKAVKLKENMVELDGDIQTIGNDQVPWFTEAPYVHERNGTYYLSYAAGWPERIVYSTSTNPMGPYRYQGIILEADDVNSPTSHQSIITYHDQSYLVYHNAELPDGGEYRRSVAMDKLEYDQSGHIKKVIPTQQGVGTPGLSGEFVVKNRLSERCLQPNQDSMKLVQHSCNATVNQTFQLRHTLDDRYKLIHKKTGQVLDIRSSSTDNGALAVLRPDSNSMSQYWNITQQDTPQAFHVKNSQSQKLLESINAVTTQDAVVGQWQNNGGYQQDWLLLRANATTITPVGWEDSQLSFRANGVWLETNPTPATSSQFKVVAGLADPQGISFESVSHPGYYLRHRNFSLYMEYNKGNTFAADATFYRRQGLSNPDKTSYESYNYPQYFIRHKNYQLVVETLSSDLDKADATFHEM
ncbi:family 43 glycosylhydrolase [Vibrio palustris]|uniref:Xylosidase/arabinosidase n=1 Tax=Vibrio palustris TaxID=1918946 RepID=A0A1R4B816_9VIBR|nr:family 43 glycosylhydrolase [Vibrio palustris]SJL85067.1 Xylosidase/arabinosidase [Vibrio palustris]